MHKLETFTDQQRAAQQRVRALIWQLYADLKDYRCSLTPCRRDQLRARFDYIFCLHTGFATLDRLLKRLHANKAELLMVLEHPEIPLHTNGSENDIRFVAWIANGARTRSSASNALYRRSAAIVGRRWSALTRSCASPPIRKKPSGLPRPSTSVWILVLS